MDERHSAQGILFYSTVYITVVLLFMAVSTGRWVFLMLILLTFALAGYMAYLTMNNTDYLKGAGLWIETWLKNMYGKVTKPASP